MCHVGEGGVKPIRKSVLAKGRIVTTVFEYRRESNSRAVL